MIGRVRICCRIELQPGITPGQRLGLMEIIEKWSVAATGSKPGRFVSSSQTVVFTVHLDRDTAANSLRGCLPRDWIRDVVIDGASWNQ